MAELTVILCTHDPRPEFLARTLASLEAQTVPARDWSLLIVDNASAEPVEPDLGWHPCARVVREERLGLTPARLRGVAESDGRVLVLVDDDNVLAPDYLAQAARIGRDFPYLGVWGGHIDPAFEIAPPEWTRPHWHLLAIQPVERAQWSNLPYVGPNPVGAGMCVRRAVAERFAARTATDPRRLQLGRRGEDLAGAEDLDLAFTACDLGLGMGLFPSLRLQHIIPAGRLTEDYLLRLVEAAAFSQTLLAAVRGVERQPSWRRRAIERVKPLLLPPLERRFHRARVRGRRRANARLADIGAMAAAPARLEAGR